MDWHGRLGILNVLYNSSAEELGQFYRALDSTLTASQLKFTTFVLDNSEVSLRHAVPKDARHSWTGVNVGYTRACNLLMERAFADGCDAVVTMNADGFPLPECVANMLATLDRSGGNALIEARQFPKEHPRYYDPVTGATDWVSGCCLLIPRPTFEQLGPLDEGMFLYCEDVDYSFRARAVGIPCLVSTNAFFYHRSNPAPMDRLRRKHHLLSARYLAAKWRNLDSLPIAERALVDEGFFRSPADMPELPRHLPPPQEITWNAANKLTYASARWS